MASNFRQSRIIVGDGDPADGDGICTNLSLFPINTFYINSETGATFVRNTANGNAADYVENSGGPGGDTIYTGDGSLSGSRNIDLDGNDLSFNNGGISFLTLNPASGAETSALTAHNTTDDNNQASALCEATATSASTKLISDFNGSVERAEIQCFADATASSITHTADTHTFNAGGETNLSVSTQTSLLRGFDPTDNDNVAIVVVNANSTQVNSSLAVDFNGGSKVASIQQNADSSSSSITYTADNHIFDLAGIPTHADDAAASGAGLASGTLYKTTTGGSTFLKIVP